MHFHSTPQGVSWRNVIELWFSILTRKPIRRGPFDTVRALVRHIQAYLDRWNAHRVSFGRSKTADEIIAKTARR